MRVVVVIALAGVTALIGSQSAFAPPAGGVPNVTVARQCFAFGRHIPVSGYGFAPGSRVVVSAPLGHYTGPAPFQDIRTVTAIADAHGRLRATLVAPRPPRRSTQYRWSYQPRVVFADGTPQVSGASRQSFTELVVASPAICRTLGRRR